jgi:GNAT superfamily N-acetyltransferase
LIEYQVEKWSDVLPEMEPLWPAHYEELSLDKDRVKLGGCLERYAEMENLGILVVVTVRSDKQLVGYYVFMLLPHLHYKDAGLMAYTDMYFLLPEFRKGGTGVKMFLAVEQAMKNAGAVKAYTSHKIHQDHSELLKRLGWKASDIVYTKYLGA